jgi:Zn finger protein HypA/HybF involved in hydrogenase expression
MGFGNPELVVIRAGIRVVCLSCGTAGVLDRPDTPCPSCGSMDRNITSGMECTVESVEIEEAGEE